MSHSLPPNLVKASTGDYHIPITSIFRQAWQCVKGIKKTFWGGFILLFLTLFIVCVLLSLVVALYVFLAIYPHNIISSLESAQLGADPFYSLLNFILVGILEILRLLLTASLAYLALNQLRHQSIQVEMVFEFRKAWRPLVLIGLLLYLFDSLALSASNFLLYYYPLTPSIFYLGFGLRFVLFVLLYTYITIGFFMAILLILDQKMSLKESLSMAFKSINQHWVKNIALILLTSFAFVVLTLLTLGIGLIWLLPMVSLVTAIQYSQIFCEGRLV